ncbi:T6SS effector amidase Tae4 family protein [Uliginosibacterium sediminicola]|uniref:T6SS effector amidase Tae4 family protein n=1 Tax=Uliginosibacterium sediminicola TaxID=2024550 RepID=A0ABU9Z183_9RHOO
MKPSYATLKAAVLASSAQATELASQATHPASINKSAVRISLALLDCSLAFMGRLPISTGKHRGKYAEPGARRLAEQLSLHTIFDLPEVFTDGDVAKHELSLKRGVVFFQASSSYEGGHIDLIEPGNAALLCSQHGYFNCKEIWFWPLA